MLETLRVHLPLSDTTTPCISNFCELLCLTTFQRSIATVYHDKKWGIPVDDGRKHFAMLSLEGAQAGCSWWIT
jgi:3-methyladenine DNA glycosylase Tag